MEMEVSFPGGARVHAHFGPYTVTTDQPPQGGGQGEAPTPFSLFLASLATCAGIYVLGFCRSRDLPTEGLRITQRTISQPGSGMVAKVELEIHIPEDFPERYEGSLIRSASLCAVKRHMEQPPEFKIETKRSQQQPA